jgi:glycosyltransferase involved in cell wall biosynthesis
MAPLISIIIPSRVGSLTLIECLNSVYWQKNINIELKIEVIVVINGFNVVEYDISEVLKHFKNIIVLKSPIASVSSARNLGLNIAKGENLIFLDDDDLLSENTFKTIIDSLPTDCILVMNVESFPSNKVNSIVDVLSIVARQSDPFEKVTKLNGRRYFQNVTAKVFPRHVINICNFNKSLKLGEDVLFMYSISPYFSNFKKLDNGALYKRRISKESTTGKNIKLSYELKNHINLIFLLLFSLFEKINLNRIILFIYLIIASNKFFLKRIYRYIDLPP